MRKPGLALCFALALTLLASGLAPAEETKKAKTIDELAAMYDSSSCQGCHQNIHDEWKKSIHSRSVVGTGRTAATIKTTVINGFMEWPYSGVKKPEDVRVEHLMLCAKCHLPQLKDATDDVAKEIVRYVYDFTSGDEQKAAVAREKLEKLNINCLICHSRNAIIHKWTDGYPERNAVYGSRDGSHPDPLHPVLKKSPVMSESILCGQCHGLGPNFELDNPSQCGTLYGTYLWSYRAEGGQESCQECHMRKSGLGHDMTSYRNVGMGKAAVDFKTDILGYIWRDGTTLVPQALVKVDLKNNAGHAIPDG